MYEQKPSQNAWPGFPYHLQICFVCAWICKTLYIYKVFACYFICGSSFENQHGAVEENIRRRKRSRGFLLLLHSVCSLVPSKSLNSGAC